MLIVIFVWCIWALFMAENNYWYLFQDNWFMSVTMALGSFIAGSTCMGGGAIAFPVMTLGFGMDAQLARDFSLMIQSVGMVSASLIIIYLRIAVEWRAIMYASIGGVFGVITGIDLVSPELASAYTKIFFVSFWLGFSTVLFLINRNRARMVCTNIRNIDIGDRFLLLVTGFLGGIVSGLTGSGLDIVTFAILVLVFSLHEKVATPSSVILMAINSVAGFFWREGFDGGTMAGAWNYWWVCVPVVVVGAPLGVRFIRNRSRHFIAGFLYYVIIIQYLLALFIIPQTPGLLLFNAIVVVAATVFFRAVAYYGNIRLKKLRATLKLEEEFG